MIRFTIGRVAAGGTLIALIVGGSVAGMAAAEKAGPDYPVNQAGLTYGSAADAENTDQEPDLIWVAGVGGKDGYVRKTDLAEPEPKNPAEAVEGQNNPTARSGRDIPVYDVTGENVIDTFHIVGADETEEVLVTDR